MSTYYEESYPPNIVGPLATGANAGIPGTWTPAGSRIPRNVQEMGNVVANPTTAWTTGQYMQTQTVGPPGRFTWSGTNWVGGVAPLESQASWVVDDTPSEAQEGTQDATEPDEGTQGADEAPAATEAATEKRAKRSRKQTEDEGS